MSRIYFHSPTNESEVRGSERAYAAHLVNEMFVTTLGVSDNDYPDRPHVLRNIIAPSHYCLRSQGQQFARELETALHVHGGMGGPILMMDGKAVDTFSASLNTALVMGSDAIKLGARLHGQCEIHAWVDGLNREWLAEMIEQGHEVGIFRTDAGWESVITHLRERADEPVVTSYSVCEQFPNAHAANWKPTKVDEDGEADWDAWYELPKETQWMKSMLGIMNTEPLLEIKPDNWNDFYFYDGLTAFDLLAKAIELDKAKAA